MTLSFSHEASTHPLSLHLPEYSGVLADCLQGLTSQCLNWEGDNSTCLLQNRSCIESLKYHFDVNPFTFLSALNTAVQCFTCCFSFLYSTPPGHRELSETVMDMSRGFHEFQFDEVYNTFRDSGIMGSTCAYIKLYINTCTHVHVYVSVLDNWEVNK